MAASTGKWMYFEKYFPRHDRVACLQTIQVERTAVPQVIYEEPQGTLSGLTINVSDHGLCVLLDWFPQRGEVLRVHMPTPVPARRTPTLADVRWVKIVPFCGHEFMVAGLKFLV